MKFKTKYKIFLLGVFVLFILASFGFAQKPEVVYPEIPDAVTPKSVKTFLPAYIRYLFNFAIVIAGLVAFASLVYGGFRYLTSAGNPVAISDAKSQITAGILGLILILGSYLLLTTINPQLVILKTGKMEIQKGVILCHGQCQVNQAGVPVDSTGMPLQEGKDFLYVRTSSSRIELEGGELINYIYFYNGNDELDVIIYNGENYQGSLSHIFNYHDAGEIKPTGFPVKSIYLRWKYPGVYLCDMELETVQGNLVCPGEEKYFIGDTATFELDNFDNKAKGIRIVDRVKRWMKCDCLGQPDECCHPDTCMHKPQCLVPEERIIEKYGAILHEKENFQDDAQVFFESYKNLVLPSVGNKTGEYEPECQTDLPGPFCSDYVVRDGEGVSSITIFKQCHDPNLIDPNNPDKITCEKPEEGVTLYANYSYNEQDNPEDKYNDKPYHCGPITTNVPLWVDKDIAPGLGYDLGHDLDNKTWWEDGEEKHDSLNNCQKIFEDHSASSIEVRGNYIAVLFRGGNDGRGQVFKNPDPRLKNSHIGDNSVRFMLVIPINP